MQAVSVQVPISSRRWQSSRYPRDNLPHHYFNRPSGTPAASPGERGQRVPSTTVPAQPTASSISPARTFTLSQEQTAVLRPGLRGLCPN